MIKIGVFGNPGAGKTTLCKYLTNKNPNIEYLSVDKLTTSNEQLHLTRNQILEFSHNNSISSDELKKSN